MLGPPKKDTPILPEPITNELRVRIIQPRCQDSTRAKVWPVLTREPEKYGPSFKCSSNTKSTHVRLTTHPPVYTLNVKIRNRDCSLPSPASQPNALPHGSMVCLLSLSREAYPQDWKTEKCSKMRVGHMIFSAYSMRFQGHCSLSGRTYTVLRRTAKAPARMLQDSESVL